MTALELLLLPAIVVVVVGLAKQTIEHATTRRDRRNDRTDLAALDALDHLERPDH